MYKRNNALDEIERLVGEECSVFKLIVQHVGPITEWDLFDGLVPMMSKHLHYNERFTVTAYMLQNACPPDLLIKWMMMRGQLKDKSARDHVADVIKKHKLGKLTKYTAKVMPFRICDHKGDPSQIRRFPIETPNAEFMEEEGWRWDAAHAMLTNNNAPIESKQAMCEVKIVPLEDLEDVDTDMYGQPVDALLEEAIDMMHANKKVKYCVSDLF